MLNPSTRASAASAGAVESRGKNRNAAAETKSEVLNTLSAPQRFTIAGSRMRTTKAATPDMASTTPIAEADSPIEWP